MKNLLSKHGFTAGLTLLISHLFLPLPAFAEQLTVENAYVRATIPGTSVSSAYMEIVNHSDKPLVLLAASSPVTDRIEIHQHTMEDGMMKMRKQASLTIPAHQTVMLQPGGYHLMIFNLATGLKAGEQIPLKLTFEGGESLQVTLPVQSIVREKSQQSHHHH